MNPYNYIRERKKSLVEKQRQTERATHREKICETKAAKSCLIFSHLTIKKIKIPSRYHLTPSHPHVLPPTPDPGARLSYTLHTPQRPARGHWSHTAKKSKGSHSLCRRLKITRKLRCIAIKILTSKRTSGRGAWKTLNSSAKTTKSDVGSPVETRQSRWRWC